MSEVSRNAVETGTKIREELIIMQDDFLVSGVRIEALVMILNSSKINLVVL
jgi:hypothetical protein